MYADKLPAHLKKGLAPVYLIAGDEHLLVAEAANAVRARARAEGCEDRRVYFAGRGFDWNELTAGGASMSLFAERRLLELRLPTGKPGKSGAAALTAYAGNAPEDAILLVISGKLDRSGANSAWVKALDRAGVFVQVYPVETARLPRWIDERMRARGMRPTRGAVELLAERVEGNLLSADQEIEKLLLLEGEGEIDEETVLRAVVDSARYDVFQLADAALLGDAARAVRILNGLRAEGSEPPLILWALTRELRQLAGVLWQMEQGQSVAAATRSVWARRQPIVSKAAQRLRHSARAHNLVLRAARADRIAKGKQAGRPWDALLELVIELSGAQVARPLRAAGGRG